MTPAHLTSALGMLVIERRKAVRKGRAHLLPAIDAASEAVAMVLRAMEEARREVPETVTGDFSPTGIYARDFPRTGLYLRDFPPTERA